jgi:hypothetical protein
MAALGTHCLEVDLNDSVGEGAKHVKLSVYQRQR